MLYTRSSASILHVVDVASSNVAALYMLLKFSVDWMTKKVDKTVIKKARHSKLYANAIC